ncbi:MAG: tetratricopeptide repeat protein [Planctomycetes bacterium]|nr:tetratricopeptide repeat protein [Planctomycetota bacterium]
MRRLATAFLSCSALAFLCSACASTTINIKYRRPPTKKIPDHIKSIGVLPMTVAENAQVEGGIGERIQGKIETALINNATYAVITRDQLKTLLAERSLQESDFAAEGKELKVEGVDALIVGTISKAVSNDAVGPITTLVTIIRKVGPINRASVALQSIHGRYVTVELSANVKMIDAKSGRIIAIGDFSQSYDSRNAENWKGKQYATPPEKLPSHGAKLEELVQAGAMEFLKQICYTEITRPDVRLITRGDYSERGYKMAVRGLIEDAVAQFDLAIQNEQPNDHALYDKGVMLEILGRYEEAYKAFKQAYTMEESDLYLDAMQRMQEEKSFVPPPEEEEAGQ